MARRESLIIVMVLVEGETELAEAVLAVGSPGRSSHSLDSRQSEADNDCDNCDNDKQLEKRDTTPAAVKARAWPREA